MSAVASEGLRRGRQRYPAPDNNGFDSSRWGFATRTTLHESGWRRGRGGEDGRGRRRRVGVRGHSRDTVGGVLFSRLCPANRADDAVATATAAGKRHLEQSIDHHRDRHFSCLPASLPSPRAFHAASPHNGHDSSTPGQCGRGLHVRYMHVSVLCSLSRRWDGESTAWTEPRYPGAEVPSRRC